jgi:hypothetical protein
MDVVGWIVGPPDPFGVDEEAWVALIGRADWLDTRPAVTRVNPFTGEAVRFFDARDALLIADGGTVGEITWRPDQLVVHAAAAHRNAADALARRTADALGGELLLPRAITDTERDAILAGIDDVDWDALKSAVGTGACYRESLSLLLSDDAQERAQAYVVMDGGANQGSVSEAGAQALPFLVRILARRDYAERDELAYEVAIGLSAGLNREADQHAFDLVLPFLRYHNAEFRCMIAYALAQVPQRAKQLRPALERAIAFEMNDPEGMADTLREVIATLGE